MKSRTGRTWTTLSGSLSYDGTQIIVGDWRKKLSLFKVDDLTERVITEDPRFLAAWSDSQTGGLFLLMMEKELEISEPEFRMGALCDLLYFSDIESLIKWRPAWIRNKVDRLTSGICWIPGADVFALCSYSSPQFGKSSATTLIDAQGSEVGKFEVPGDIIGIDQNESRLEVFYSIATRDDVFTVNHAWVNDQRNSLESKSTLFPVDLSANRPKGQRGYMGLSCRFQQMGKSTRAFRMRGGRQGDVRCLVTEFLGKPAFWQTKSIPSVGPVEPLLRFQQGMGLLSAQESESAYEIVNLNTGRQDSIVYLVNRSGESIRIPYNHCRVADALVSDDTSVILIEVPSESPDHYELRVLTRELKP